MSKGFDYKIKYMQAYIHIRKHQYVQIRLPQSAREEQLMNQAYTIAKQTMKQMGKQINV
jgi:predicted pyridoxine 5'-phosphate oxidase superfamily flavin-nucleotide-binding protein